MIAVANTREHRIQNRRSGFQASNWLCRQGSQLRRGRGGAGVGLCRRRVRRMMRPRNRAEGGIRKRLKRKTVERGEREFYRH
jgi:hypothetical protein